MKTALKITQSWDFPGGQVVKILDYMQGAWVSFLVRELRSAAAQCSQKVKKKRKENLSN